MFEQDYILRLVKQLVEGLRRIVALRREDKREEAWRAASELSERLVGLRLEALETLPPAAILEVCRGAGDLDVARAAGAARLCFEAARIRDADGAAQAWDSKAFALFDELLARDDADDALIVHRDVMEELFERMG